MDVILTLSTYFVFDYLGNAMVLVRISMTGWVFIVKRMLDKTIDALMESFCLSISLFASSSSALHRVMQFVRPLYNFAGKQRSQKI